MGGKEIPRIPMIKRFARCDELNDKKHVIIKLHKSHLNSELLILDTCKTWHFLNYFRQ